MPKDFINCIKRGGKVRTKTIDKNHYIHICILNGKTYAGEVHTKITAKKKRKK